MKFTQKIFLITFAFVTISINLIGIIIINNNYKTQIDAKMESNISNINNISSVLKFYNITEMNVDVLKKDNIYYEISNENNIIYTNLLFDMSEIKEQIEPTEENIKSIISKEILFMSVKTGEYNIIIAENLEDVFMMREEQIYFFIKVSMIFSFIIAFCLYLAIHLLTRRIKKLNKAVEKIANGNYSTRVKKLGKDEVGDLAIAFNKMAKSIENTIKEIETVSENRQNFIHNITHEIRTPLTSIIGYSSLIKNGKVDEKEKIIEYNNKIYEEGNYLNLISERLMDIVLLNNKKMKLENIDVSKTVQEIIESIQFDYKEVNFYKNIELDINFKSDKVLLHSLIVNLVKNAIMSYEENSEKVINIILKQLTSKTIILSIIDKGKGMTAEQLQKVTEPFYTLNKDRNRKISGMGLGLPLCIKICDVINAELKIESMLGKGTAVNIEFNI